MADAVQNDWFWNEVESDLGPALDDKARAAIDNVLRLRSEQTATDEKQRAADIRLSFLSHYLVIKWGREKRGKERLIDDRKKHPILTRENIMTLIITWMIALAGMYTITSVAVYFLGFALKA